MLGGEHLVTLGAVRSVAAKHPDLHVIHFDAHSDLRDKYYGQKLSHATVMRRVWDIVGDGRIFQYGIRSGEREEVEWGKSHVYTNFFNCNNLDYAIETIKDKPVYLSIDLDVLDSSVLPGTGTPEAGGISFNELIQSIFKMSELNIVAADVNELSPHYDASGSSTLIACKVLRELLLMLG
jgi:agmatinase